MYGLAGMLVFHMILPELSMLAEAAKKAETENGSRVKEAVAYIEGEPSSNGEKKDNEKKNVSAANTKETKLVESSMKQGMDMATASYQKDQKLQKLLKSGTYTEKNPYVEVDPYGTSPLTAMVLFQSKEACAVKVAVRGKKASLDVSGKVTKITKDHRVPVVGLYAGKNNKVQIQLLDKKGNVLRKFFLDIKTKKLPKTLKDAVLVKKHTKASAYGLTVVSGFDTPYPFAFDETGDIRWYMSGVYDTYGYFPLSDGRFLLMDGEICTQTFVKPMSQAVNEMDYMGRVYQTYMVEKGVHHEVIEKTPGGNLLVLTNSLKKHSEDCIQEIDRKTGAVVKTLDMRKLFGKKFQDMVDWAHLNTVSYNPKDHCILVSVRNCDAVVKIDWRTDKIIWILADESLYRGTKLYKYVLKAKGSGFFYPYQQHSAYEIMENLDDNKNTVEIMMFDNHFVSKRLVPGFDGKRSSFVTIYSVNGKKKTVEIWKSFPGVKSKVYSNYCFDQEAGRVFFMGGCLKKAWKPGHRKGVIYEFDYASEKVLNVYSLKNTFYRAYELALDLNLAAEPLSRPKQTMLGKYYTFRESGKEKTVPAVKVASDKIRCSLKGDFLYVHSMNRQITKIELAGTKKSYSFQLAARAFGDGKFRKMEFSTVISLEGLEADRYQVIVVAKGQRQDTGNWFQME